MGNHQNTEYWVHLTVAQTTDILPDQIKRDHPLQDSFSVLHRKSGDLEVTRSIIQSSVQITLFTAKCHTETRLDRKTN